MKSLSLNEIFLLSPAEQLPQRKFKKCNFEYA